MLLSQKPVRLIMVMYMKKYFRFIGFLIVLLSAGYIFLVNSVMPPYIRQMLPVAEQVASQMINGSITIGDLTWDGGLQAEIDNIVVKDAKGAKVAELPRTIVHFRPWRAFNKGAAAISKVELMRPKAYLVMDAKEQWNMQNLLKPSDSDETPFYGLLEISQGSVAVITPQGQWELGIKGTVDGGANPKFAVDLQAESNSDRMQVTGLMTTKGEGRLEIKGDKLALAPYAALAKHFGKVEELQGGLGKYAVLYINEKDKRSFSGEVALASLQGKMAANGELHSLKLDGLVKAADNLLTTKSLQIAVDGQLLQLDCAADLRDSDLPKGEGVLTAAKLEYAGYKVGKLRVPFHGSKKEIVLEKATVAYGGGDIVLNATYDVDEKNLLADLDVQHVTHTPVERPMDAVTVSGKLAVLAAVGEESIKVHAATDAADINWRNLSISKLALDGSVNGDGLKIDHFSAAAGERGLLLASGTVAKNGAVDLKGRMTDFPINPVLDLAGQEGSGFCSTGFAIGGTITAPEFAGIVQLSNATIMQQQIKEAHGYISLKDNLLDVKDFTAQMEQGQHILNGSVDLRGEQPYLDLALETYGVRIEPLMRLVTGDAQVTGNVDNVVQVRGTPDKLHVYGEVHASDGSAVKQLFNRVDGRYIYENGRLELQDFLISAFIASIKLNGVMTADKRLDFSMEAQNVDLAHLPIKDETVNLEGRLNASGHLGGTLTTPTFDGDINSEKIYINGEALTELKGTLTSNAKEKNFLQVTFKQPYRDDPLEYGMYGADLNLDFVQRTLQGKVMMVWGDVGGLLRMSKQDYDINGVLQGQLDINPQGKGSGIIIKVQADDVKVHNLSYAHAIFNGSLKKGVLYFDDVKLQEQEGVEDRGLITVAGSVDLLQKQLDVRMEAAKANPAIATAVMKNPPAVSGEMDMLVTLGGTFANPAGEGALTVANGSVAGVGFDSLAASLNLKDDHINLEQLQATKDAYGVKAAGDIPLDIFRSKEQRRNPRAEMNITMDLNEARLGILPAMTKMVEWGVGETQGQVRLAGTLEEPLLYGSLKVTDGAVKVKDLDTVLESINLDVDFQGNNVLLRDLSTKLGKGKLSAQGSYALHTTEDVAYNLQIKADNAELASQIFTGRINADVQIVPQKYRDRKQRIGNVPPPIEYRPLIKGNVRLDDVLVNMPTIPEMGEGESNLGMDLSVQLGRKIHLYNSYLYDIWLAGGLDIKGSTLWPLIDGNIKAEKGTITYLRTDFKLEDAKLVWITPGSFLPEVSLTSKARFSRYNIYMKVLGPVEEMDLQLTSDPPMERNTIVRMLTLQRDTAGSNEVTGEDMNNLMTVGLQMTVLGDVEMLIKQTLGLDQFRIYTGKVRSGIGFESTRNTTQDLTTDERNQYNVLVSKYIGGKFLIGYTTSFDALDRSVFGQYDISNRFNLTYSRKYDMYDKTEDWYGLEYKVSF